MAPEECIVTPRRKAPRRLKLAQSVPKDSSVEVAAAFGAAGGECGTQFQNAEFIGSLWLSSYTWFFPDS